MTHIQPAQQAHRGRTDAGTDGDAGTCPADMSAFRERIGQVLVDVREGRVVRIHRERTRHGLAWVLVLASDVASAGQAAAADANKTHQAVTWMIQNDQLARRPFFEACPWARNSASLHHRAVTRIRRAGLAERIAGTWVLKDHATAVAWLRAREA